MSTTQNTYSESNQFVSANANVKPFSEVEVQVQKFVISFCKFLPEHVATWTSVLQETVKPLQVLSNLTEQQRHVRKANLAYMGSFEEGKEEIEFQISSRIEEELAIMKILIDKLSKTNNDLKNRLFTLERSTLDLDWDNNSLLIRGSGSQPPLQRILQNGLEFYSFFNNHTRNIGDSFKKLRKADEDFVKNLQKSFHISLEDKTVTTLIALTQYVDNESAIL